MNTVEKLFEFIKDSPTSYHASRRVAGMLNDAGYTAIDTLCAKLEDGKGYYIRRGGAIIAFRKRPTCRSFLITASHSDSPALKLLYSPESHTASYTRFSVERYGGAINYTWLDRPLSVAGRVVVRKDGALREELVNLSDLLVTIPSVAPHLNRGVNDSFAPNPALDLQPLYAIGSGKDILSCVADASGVCACDVVSHDLYLYSAEYGRRVGASGELVLAPRIDDLASVYTATEAFISAPDTDSTPILAVFDNEEVGSSTKEGAASMLLPELIERLCPDNAAREEALLCSLMLSVDGVHAMHPNHPELSNPECRPVLGGGVVVKYNANRRYATDAVSDALLRTVAENNGITLQSYANRADLPGGSTLGSIAATALSVATVDIGIPQLAMHSIAETAAVADIAAMLSLLSAFYSSSISKDIHGLRVK